MGVGFKVEKNIGTYEEPHERLLGWNTEKKGILAKYDVESEEGSQVI